MKPEQIVGISLIRRRQGKPAAAEPMDDIFDDRAGLAENQIVMRDDRRRSERRQSLVGGRRCPGRGVLVIFREGIVELQVLAELDDTIRLGDPQMVKCQHSKLRFDVSWVGQECDRTRMYWG